MLPFQGPIEPMLAKLSSTLPEGDGWLYEPKWDGFRALVWKDGDHLELQSRDLKPLARYFPELAAALAAQLPERIVLDGEIVIARDGRLDFEALLLRIHPAASRIELLAQETPSSFVAWDVLALGDDDVRARPLAERRRLLAEALAGAQPPLHVTPATSDVAVARDWFQRFEGAGLDGVVSKKLDGVYVPGQRVMVKTKHVRTADCVVAGFRWFKGHKGKLVGSLLLGLYDDEGKLHHAGVCAAFSTQKRQELAALLAPLRENAREHHPWAAWASFEDEPPTGGRLAGGGPASGLAGAGEGLATAPRQGVRMPGATSRWNRGKDLSWEPLRLERVVEVKYDHLQGDRFRHATQFVRWRDDRKPESCRYDQLEVTPPAELSSLFAAG